MTYTASNAMERLRLTTTKPPFSSRILLSLSFKEPQSQNQQHEQRPNFPYKTSLTKPNINQTKQIHAHMIVTRFDHNRQTIPDTFVRPHSSPEAQHSFLISSYNHNNHPTLSLKVYSHFRAMDFQLDCYTIPSVLKAAAQSSSALIGQEVHGYALKNGHVSDVVVLNALIQMYTEFGSVSHARQVFDRLPSRDVSSWSTMIRCFTKNSLYGEALELVRAMFSEGVRPGEMGMVTMANLFAGLGDSELGRAMHGYTVRDNLDEQFRASIDTSLIDMYVNNGNLGYAKKLFEGLDKRRRSVVSWTVMIAGFIRSNELTNGTKLFGEMLEEKVIPNEVTLLSLVTECGSVGAVRVGKCLHSYIVTTGIVVSLPLATAMIEMYGKSGDIGAARALFDRTSDKDVWIYSAMISGYVKSRLNAEARDLFSQMVEEGTRPNEVTMVRLISLSAEMGALGLGKWLHLNVSRHGVRIGTRLQTALVDMYAKSGDIDSAGTLFRSATCRRDAGLWNAMITGLAMHGNGPEALSLFEEMECSGTEPDGITFVALLKACSHSGLVSQGRYIFDAMSQRYKLVPRIEHYGCLVDLLGRAGKLDEAYEAIKTMPVTPNVVVWGSLLAACKVHKNPELGEAVSREILRLDPGNCSYNILMSNIFAAAGKWTDVAGVRTAVKDSGARKEPGQSSVEVDGSVHGFVTGDMSHPRTAEIYEMVEEMRAKVREAGHSPDTSVVFQNLEEEEKETSVNYHSERLAMAFALIATPAGTSMRVVKNLRVCDDCHAVTKLLSKIYDRVIIVRDRNRFHHFKDGSCSCGDYW